MTPDASILDLYQYLVACHNAYLARRDVATAIQVRAAILTLLWGGMEVRH